MKMLHAGQSLPTTDDEAKQYIPEYAHELYGHYRAMGKSVEEALTKTLESVVSAGRPEMRRA